MRDTRFEPLPNDPMARIKRYIYDLTWGVLTKTWGESLYPFRITDKDEILLSYDTRTNDLRDYQKNVWDFDVPSVNILVALGYLLQRRTDMYHLSNKAFQLIEEPLSAKIFISYMHEESSAAALLIKYRLQALNPTLNIFMDYTGLTHGSIEGWQSRLEKAVKECDYFICLTTNKSLQSNTIQDEIQWALDSDKERKIIPIWHNHFERPTGVSEWLERYLNIQAIVIKIEDAAAYDTATDQLLNYFR